MIEILILLSIPHLFSIGALLLIYFARHKPSSVWLLQNLNAILLFSAAWFAGTWAYSSIYFKYVYALLMIGFIAFFAVSRMIRKDYYIKFIPSKKALMINGIASVVLIALNVLIVKAYFYPAEEAMELQFPLRSGKYYVIQGGNSPVTNFFHNDNADQKYALDIIKLYPSGSRADGIYPNDFTDYAVYADTVYSPISGTVIMTTDTFPNNSKNQLRLKYPYGNFVVVLDDRMKNAVLLAHFIPNTSMVKVGDVVEALQPLALVGNSGNSIEPHLHIQAATQENGKLKAIPIKFEDGFVAINSIIEPED